MFVFYKISILNYRLEFRLISRFCNETPFHEVDGVSMMNHNGENQPVIGCYRSVRLIEIPIYNSKLIFYATCEHTLAQHRPAYTSIYQHIPA